MALFFIISWRFSLKSLERTRNGKQALLDYHLLQSFSPEEGLSSEEVHELGRQANLELTGGEYEFVIETHVDKAHLHNVRPDRVLSQVV